MNGLKSEVKNIKFNTKKGDKIYISGKLGCEKLTMCRQIVEDLSKIGRIDCTFEFVLALETPFEFHMENLIKENSEFAEYNASPVVYIKNENAKSTIIGNLEHFLDFVVLNFSHYEDRSVSLFKNPANQILSDYLDTNGNKYVYFDISMSGETLDRLVIELFFNEVPETCLNFFSLCKGFNNDTIINRVVKNAYIQGGDLNEKEIEGRSIYKGEFPDENYSIKHTAPGLVGMVKKGNRRHSNESFDGLFVLFGRVVQGFKSLKRIENTVTDLQRPVHKIQIVECGEFKVNSKK